MSEAESVKGELKRSWVAHEFTQETARALDKSAKQAMDALRGACRESSDPRVAAAFQRLVVNEEMVAYFRNAGVK